MTEQRGIAPPGFALPDETRVGGVTLQVADVERSLGFYRDVLGFRVLERTDGNARLGAREGDATLLSLREKRGARPVPRRGLLGLYHFAVLLPSRGDLGRFLRHAAATGVHVGAADHQFSEATYLVDPDGLTIEVYRDRPRDEWIYRNGEAAAVSDPLDVHGLAEAAGDAPWEGLPAGTTLGHMHFYVGDIPAAERFYHAGLGFAKTIWSWPGALFVSAGGYHHHAGLNTWAAGAPIATDEDARLLEWELVLPDQATITAAADSLDAAGFVTKRNFMGDAHAVDPWGNKVHLVRG